MWGIWTPQHAVSWHTMKSYEIKSSFPFSLVDKIIPWNPLESLGMPPKSKWSSFHRGVLTDRSISGCSQNTDSDPAASKTQNMPSACLQCWNSLGWEVAPRAWDRCDLGTTAEGSEKKLKFRHCSDCVSSSSVGKTCPKPFYSKFQKSFECFSMCSPWHSETPSEPVASLWTKPFASCTLHFASFSYV